MFDEPSEEPIEQASDPKSRAREKADEFRMHAEIAAVFEGPRKFEAELIPGLDADLARMIQRGMAKLEKAKSQGTPVLPASSAMEAAEILNIPTSRNLSTNDYHLHRRPGEVMIARWLVGDQVESFYTRFQAHFEAAMEGYKEEEKQAQEWKQDAQTLAYLEALDAIKEKMPDKYLRDTIRKHNLYVLSTQTADEINIAYLSDYVMGVSPADLVGSASAPPEGPTEQELAWFYKLFSLRGMNNGVEQMCFFTFLQKSDEMF